MDRERLIKSIKLHEGFRYKLYKDSIGKLTIGFGWNIEDKGIRPSEAEFRLNNDIEEAIDLAKHVFSNFEDLSDIRQRVLIEMCFNLGSNILEFYRFINFIHNLDFDNAAMEMRNSLWYSQVGFRGRILETMFRTNQDPA